MNTTVQEYRPGQMVWTRKTLWSVRFGGGMQPYRSGHSEPLYVRPAKHAQVCFHCRREINKGELHAARDYIRATMHLCLGCVRPDEPAEQRLPMEARVR